MAHFPPLVTVNPSGAPSLVGSSDHPKNCAQHTINLSIVKFMLTDRNCLR